MRDRSLKQFCVLRLMFPGPAASAAIVASSVGVGGVGYWAKQLLLAIASQQGPGCPDCACNCQCPPPSAGPVQEVFVDCVCPAVSWGPRFETEPAENWNAVVVAFFIAFVFGYFFGARRRGHTRAESVKAPALSAESHDGARISDSPARGSRGLPAGLGRRTSVSDPLRW